MFCYLLCTCLLFCNKLQYQMDGKSLDITNQKIEELKALFPDVFTEGKIDIDRLKAALGEDIYVRREHYELSWAGKTEARKEVQKQTTATLIPDREGSIDFDNAQNIFIEGENLEVLRALQKSYFGKVKMIYIDPPYNTGNDSFVYPDDYTERREAYNKRTGITDDEGYLNKQDLWKKNSRENGQFHSVWLSMLYPRLYLARNLMREDGVIFVSIDDNEQANLKLLMDDVFGEENFIGCITINGNPRGRDYGGIAGMHDYLYLYAKNSTVVEINNVPEENKEFDYNDVKGGFDIRELRNRNIAFNSENRPNLYYPFYVNPAQIDENGFYEISLTAQKGWIELFPKESQGFKTVWRWGKEKAKQNLNSEIVGKSMQDGGYQIIEKYRESSRMARSIWFDKDVNTEKGTLTIKNLFKAKVFPLYTQT